MGGCCKTKGKRTVHKSAVLKLVKSFPMEVQDNNSETSKYVDWN